MYWQVYLHKTVLVAEYTLMRILKRAKELAHSGRQLFATPALDFFLKNDIDKQIFQNNAEAFRYFAVLDDFDVLAAIKVWTNHDDKVLSSLSKCIVNRRFFRIEMEKEKFADEYIVAIREKTKKKYSLSEEETDYFVFADKTSNYAYRQGVDKINILYKDGSVHDISEISDDLNISLLSKPVTKYFLCYPKDVQ